MNVLERFRTPDKELERNKLELSNSYRQIMGTMAFKNLQEEMEKLYRDSFKESDQCDIKQFNVAVAAESRGVRKAIDTLRRKIDNSIKEIQ